MARKTVEDMIKKGLCGAATVKVDERILFLGSIRERVELALFHHQVAKELLYPEVEETLASKKDIFLLLNGKIPYPFLSKYIKLADKHHVPFSMICDFDNETEIGLVIINKSAVDNPKIFVE